MCQCDIFAKRTRCIGRQNIGDVAIHAHWLPNLVLVWEVQSSLVCQYARG
jgi:hypothetical protein